ncbi:MAG: response regulator transcription factor [Candidatus Omnitrophica bacterium]|nr:response regulator transcription factor [Candidatus Omnitrophota bacterium]
MEDKIKIPLIDDDENFCRLIKQFFQAQGGYKVLVANRGGIGTFLSKMRWHKPHIVLLDIKMPGLDGFEVLQKIRQEKTTMYMPVIMVTGVGELSAKIKAEGLYCTDYIVKPFDLNDLKAKVDALLKQSQ